MCQRENLHQIDLLNGSKNRITEREYHARRRGQQELDELNQQIIADGLTPKRTKFETDKDKSSGKRRQHIHIQYDGLGFIPLNELLTNEKA